MGRFRDAASIGLRRMEARALVLSGATKRRLARRTGSVGILMYHRVLPDTSDATGIEPGMFVRAGTFERQLRFLRERFRVVTLAQALEARPRAGDPPAVALTFDDGWRDNLEVAWPVLERLGVRCTIFLVRDWSEHGRTDAGEFVRPDEVRELARLGVEFGAHTVGHPHLPRIAQCEVETEMRRSKEAVEDWTACRCASFAYPFGDHDEETAALARGLFRGSVLAEGGWWDGAGDFARIPRIAIHEDMTSTDALFETRLAAQGRA